MARRAIATFAVLVVLLACSEGGLREDEVLCEEAVAHLGDCCPGFDPTSVACRYHKGSCGTTYPDLTAVEGECIRDRECEDLVSSGVCAVANQSLDAGSSRSLDQVACR